jgi:alanine racemase
MNGEQSGLEEILTKKAPWKKWGLFAAEALARADRNRLKPLITRLENLEDFKQTLKRKPDDIKVVIQFSEI